jgi:hypothetical protein
VYIYNKLYHIIVNIRHRYIRVRVYVITQVVHTHTHTHTVGDTGAIHGYHLLVAARLAISDGKPILFFHSFLSLFVTSGQSKDKVWRTIYLYIYIYIYVACKRQKKDRKGRTYLATRGPPGAAP